MFMNRKMIKMTHQGFMNSYSYSAASSYFSQFSFQNKVFLISGVIGKPHPFPLGGPACCETQAEQEESEFK